jgi:hypothetical protein
MNGILMLYISQYGDKFYARTVKSLKEDNCLPGKISKMYIDKKDGTTKHIGYVIGGLWLTAYTPYEG